MATKSILLFADRLAPLIGGMEMHARYFIEYFNEHPMFPLLGVITKAIDGNDHLITKDQERSVNITELAEQLNPDIIFFNSGRWISQIRELRNCFPSARFIYRTGGNEIIKASLENHKSLSHRLRQEYWVASLNQTIDLLITNSAYTERRMHELGINCAIYRCVGGVNMNALKGKSAFMRKGPLRLFCAARFVPYKNHSLLILVFHELILRGLNIRLRLAGDGPLLSSIKELVNSYKLGSLVKFLGPISNEKVCQEMLEADAYIQFSCDYRTKVPGGEYTHSEGMGRSILEAVSAGTYVIAGKSGALPEIIKDDVGVLIELDNLKNVTEKVEIALKKLPIELAGTDDYSWKKIFNCYEKIMMMAK